MKKLLIPRLQNLIKGVRESAQVALSVTVYVWALAFQAVIALDSEPLLDRLMDGAAILLTMGFWALVVSFVSVVAAVLIKRTDLASVARRVSHILVLLSTGYFLAQWLNSWPFSAANRDAITLLLLVACFVLGVYALAHRRHRKKILLSGLLPPLPELFWFFAFPVLACATLLVGIRMVTFAVESKQALASLHRLAPGEGESQNSRQRPNVVLVVMDALRARNMSLHGYSRETTPFLVDFARRSTVYERAHVNSTSTQVSIASILTGRHPLSNGKLTKYQTVHSLNENLLAVLKRYGYITTAIVSNWDSSLHHLGFASDLSVAEVANFQLPSLHGLRNYGIPTTNAGARMYENLAFVLQLCGFPPPLYGFGDAGSTLGHARSRLSIDSPFFLFVHLHEPHSPYYAPLPFRGRFFSPLKRSQREALPKPVMYTSYDIALQSVVDTYRDEYDESISYADFELGRFLKAVEDDREVREKTLIIITSDHGESFEKGFLGHGPELFESSTHVPLIVRWPDQKEGKRIDERAESIDIAPTILETLQIPIPDWMQGKPLKKVRQEYLSSTIAVNFKFPVGKSIYSLPTEMAIWHGDFKAIFSCVSNTGELYDLSDDSNEQFNLWQEAPVIRDDLRNRLRGALIQNSQKDLIRCVEK